MRILFDATVFKERLTGVGKTTLYLYEACKKVDPTFKAIGISDADLHMYDSACISMIKMNCNIKERIKQLDEFLEENEDIKIMHYPWNGYVYYSGHGLKIATTIHDLLPLEIPHYFGKENKLIDRIKVKLKKKLYLNSLRKDMKKTDCCFTVSNYSRVKILKYLHTEATVLYHGVTVPQPSEKIYDFKYILYVGGFDGRKGLVQLVKAFNEINNKLSGEIKLVIVGERKFISDEFDRLLTYGINEGSMILPGYVSDDNLSNLISNALVLCYFSEYEGFGLPVVEANALGCPVITTKGTSLPEIAGDSAEYVNPNNIKETSNKLLRMINDNEYREACIKKGFENADRFNWNTSARRFLDTIGTVAQN